MGSRVLVVADRRRPRDLGRRLVLPRPDALFVETPAGDFERPDHAATSPGRDLPSLDAVAAELDRLLKRGSDPI